MTKSTSGYYGANMFTTCACPVTSTSIGKPSARAVSHLSSGQRLAAVNFDAAKSPLPHCPFNHLSYAPAITLAVDKGKANQAVRLAGNDARDFRVSLSC
jgi:hypothetical protein